MGTPITVLPADTGPPFGCRLYQLSFSVLLEIKESPKVCDVTARRPWLISYSREDRKATC